MMRQFCFILISLQLYQFTSQFSIFGKESYDADKNEISKPSLLLSTKCKPCPKGVLCVPQIQCPAHVLMRNHEKPQTCDLSGGKFGLCCLTGQNHSVYSKEKERFSAFPNLSENIIEEAQGRFVLLMENAAGAAVQRGHPDFMHNIVFHSSGDEDIESFQISVSAMEEIITAQVFREREDIPIEDFETNVIDVDFGSTPIGHHCRSPPLCFDINAKYRTVDGSCNNKFQHRSMWGAAGQAMERLLPPAYEDGVWLPRTHSVDGSSLTGAREISKTILKDSNRTHPKFNLLVMQFGQFLAHDVTQSASIRLENGESIECCTPDGSGILPTQERHFACMPIAIDPQDEFYGRFKQRCMNFVRLSLSPNSNCKIGYGKQRSKVTHFIDASQVYGSNLHTAKSLRTFRGGKLRMLDDFGRDLLPLTNEKQTCASTEPGSVCFKSGDGRTNQIISLVAIHILFAREHNRIASALSQINPHLTDEIIYQEARRIVIAELQHIVYNEYLPIIIGPTQMERFRLSTKEHGYAEGYSADLNPSVTNEFTGAAFRFGHSTVDGKFHLQSNIGIDEVINIADVMFNPSRMRKPSFLDRIINTLLNQPMQQVDEVITHGLSRFLFRGGNPFGLDLAALNIQRGRDHALRGYNDYLEVIGQQRIQNFNEFSQEIGRKLARVYRHPDDIDLWVGGLLESKAAGGLVGLTFSEIIADQFSRLKHGDRYFYEYGPNINPGAFTLAQLNEIRKSSLARIICDNADHTSVLELRRFAFVRSGFAKGNVKCTSNEIPGIDLGHWKV